MAFEVIHKGKHILSPRGVDPFVNCGKQRIIFNKAALEILNIDRVFILYDRVEGRAGVRPTEDEMGYKITRSKHGNQGFITCKSFLELAGMAGVGSIRAERNGDDIIWNVPPNR